MEEGLRLAADLPCAFAAGVAAWAVAGMRAACSAGRADGEEAVDGSRRGRGGHDGAGAKGGADVHVHGIAVQGPLPRDMLREVQAMVTAAPRMRFRNAVAVL